MEVSQNTLCDNTVYSILCHTKQPKRMVDSESLYQYHCPLRSDNVQFNGA